MVFEPRAVVVVPSLADTLKVAAPLKSSVGVNVMPAKAVLASAMVAANRIELVYWPVNEFKPVVDARVIVPLVAVTVTVRYPLSTSPTVTPEIAIETSSSDVRVPPESLTVGTAEVTVTSSESTSVNVGDEVNCST